MNINKLIEGQREEIKEVIKKEIKKSIDWTLMMNPLSKKGKDWTQEMIINEVVNNMNIDKIITHLQDIKKQLE